MATIEKRGPRQYRAKVRKKGHKAITKTFMSKKDAEEWAAGKETDINRGHYKSSAVAENTTLRSALERYRDEIFPRLSGEGKSELARLNRLIEHLGEFSLSALETSHVATYRDARLHKDKVAAQTVKHELGLLNRVLKQCVIDWGIHLPQGIVTALVRKPNPPAGRDRRLQPGEEEALLKAARESNSSDIEPIIIIALETAARRGEIASMRWEEINLKRQTWHIPITKNNTPRTIPLSSRAVETLKKQPHRIDGRVWSLKRPDSITQAFDRLCKQQNKSGEIGVFFNNLRFHDLRHEATSRFFEKGLNIMEAASITGHKDLQMLKRYTHLRAEDLAQKLG